jgi:sulfite exporter TauE/SafE
MVASLLLFGLLLGVRHALEADHVAAVAAMASRARTLRDHIKLAGAWGVGHACALLTFGGLVLALGLSLPEAFTRALEGLAGIVLIALGIDVLRRARRSRVHFHVHEHHDGTVHLHAHAHETTGVVHDTAAHEHDHPRGVLSRALLVGSVHGLAGSAALVLIPLQSSGSVLQAFAYLIAFGAGSIAGMVLFSAAISVPLRLSARHLGLTLRMVEGVLGTLTIVLGCWITATILFGGGMG